MEKSFANAMAVSEFETRRYIIPYAATPLTGGTGTANNVLNWFYDINKDGYVFSGAENRDSLPGEGNKKLYEDLITATEDTDGNNAAKDFPETFTAWSKGIRAYRVKFIITQTLTSSQLPDGKALLNPLPENISIDYGGDKPINLDLSKIPY